MSRCTKGPTKVGNALAPVGLPVLFTVNFPANQPGNTFCIPANIPNDPQLRGLSVYMTLLSLDATGRYGFIRAFADVVAPKGLAFSDAGRLILL